MNLLRRVTFSFRRLGLDSGPKYAGSVPTDNGAANIGHDQGLTLRSSLPHSSACVVEYYCYLIICESWNQIWVRRGAEYAKPLASAANGNVSRNLLLIH